ncbi:MAG TPA: hemolysin III family protein [Arenimonas sp.]|uniref:PAQR family membrane homeostasis protein TrhA n=1 Tax=Arenimonas sp. TaxID=1872635 RepID=UPI002BE588CE|nr:hemolysin III family protein [Arenimonas sp.]HMB56105.1 hemolysin III family protein [Arenimonas sp.]
MSDRHELREEIWNALTHGVAFLLSLAAGSVLITLAALRGDGWQLASAIVFAIALVLLYCSSTLYHAIPHPAAKARLKIFDHCAIFILIAGTYTPFTLIGLRGHGGWGLFTAAWTLAVLGVVFKLFYTGRFKGVSTLIYIGMGWMIVVAIKPFLREVPMSTLLWLLGGGIAYTLGTLFYMSKRVYMHAVWHGFVMLGSLCHFVAVSMQVLTVAA